MDVAEKIDSLRKLDPDFRVFGSREHRYQFGPKLSEAQVENFEKKFGIDLPNAYRTFLTNVGNGGAGPFYGLFALGEMDDGIKSCRWQEGDFVGVLRQPFPHTDRWNLTESQLDFIKSAAETEVSKLEERYFSPINGAMPICHEGCAIREWLVLAGPEAGNIWRDARAEYGGLSPVASKSKARSTFTDWYSSWLDASLAELRSR